VGVAFQSGGASTILIRLASLRGIREEVKSKAPLIWDWVGNPADVSVMVGTTFGASDMLEIMARNQNFDLLIANISEDAPFRKQEMTRLIKGEVEGYIKIRRENSKPLLVVVGEKSLDIKSHDNWRWRFLSEMRTQFIAANIPTYPTIGRAAKAARKLIDYYKKRSK